MLTQTSNAVNFPYPEPQKHNTSSEIKHNKIYSKIKENIKKRRVFTRINYKNKEQILIEGLISLRDVIPS